MGEIKMDVQRMVKRRKDNGFTLIELMIVIAIIGILAVVLVPKMSGVKDSAKSAGVITNARSVEAYVQTRIDSWNRQGTSNTASTDILANFTGSGKDSLTNPVSGGTAIVVDDFSDAAGTATTPVKGQVVVTINNTIATNGITIKGYGIDENDKVYDNTVNPN